MSGGRIAIAGFDYQGIVILDHLFDHFDRHGPTARARPEGQDDLDLVWSEDGRNRCHHIQVKKPRENDAGVPTRRPWRLSEVADELLPNTLDQLKLSDSLQTWVLGDPVQSQVRKLLGAGLAAPTQEPRSYWTLVQRMARSQIADHVNGKSRKVLLKWKFEDPSNVANQARDNLIGGFDQLAQSLGASSEQRCAYRDRVLWLHGRLPSAFTRIALRDDYGTEVEVGKRFKDRLEREYRLPPDVVEHTLFDNFRTYINDVAKEPGKLIDRANFEIRLRSAWPQMSPATEPPAPSGFEVLRADLIEILSAHDAAKVTEVIGISGAGKTTLAGQAAAALRAVDPDRVPVYVRVRKDAVFRDVLSGVAFYLLRRGLPELFGPAIESRIADDTVIGRLAEICCGLKRPIQLLFDLVDGACSPEFGRDCGRFAEALPDSSCRLVCLGQEAALGPLSGVAKASVGIRQLNVRGFVWEEFHTLVSHYHGEVDREALWTFFQRVTVGRAAGLDAQLAHSLARLPSISAMQGIANGPTQDMISAAERRRFDSIADGVRPAAERLVCFALAFRRQDAERAFPEQNVGGAIAALTDLGLLRAEPEGYLEMHETVRAGLESGIAPAVRCCAHEALAAFYSQNGDVAAQIFHLGRAGRPKVADQLARNTFLRGKRWRSLASYVAQSRLVSVQEVVDVVARPGRIDDLYLLRSVLPQLAPDDAAGRLEAVLFQQRHRYFTEHDWARTVVETILTLAPSRFQAVVEFTVSQAKTAEERRAGLAWLRLAGRQVPKAAIDQLAAYARLQPPEVQSQLLPLLFLRSSQTALALAFDIWSRLEGEDARREIAPGGMQLAVENIGDVLEILAALPGVPAPQMIATQSLGFGRTGVLLWAARQKLLPLCVTIFQDAAMAPDIKAAAWRVLIFVGHPAIETLADPLAPGVLSFEMALLGPAFSPVAYDTKHYEEVLLNATADANQRMQALTVLFVLQVDFGTLRAKVAAQQNDPLAALWDTLFLLFFPQRPFEAGVGILQSQLTLPYPSPSSLPVGQMASSLVTVAEQPWPAVTDLLCMALNSGEIALRQGAALSLARRRAVSAIPALKCQLRAETNADVAILIAQALVACAPSSVSDLDGAAPSMDLMLWQCVAAMRTRDVSFAPQLIKLACDRSIRWEVRRMAIWAAGRLPFSAALEFIAPEILVEQSPLVLDQTEQLHMHACIIDLVEKGAVTFLRDGEESFIELVTSVLSARRRAESWHGNPPDERIVAGWLHQVLSQDPSTQAIERLLNSLRAPLLQAATVRAFRLSGRPDQIEATLSQSASIWLAIKCICERKWVRDPDPNLCQRLRLALAKAPCGGAPILGRIVDEIEQGRQHAGTTVSPVPATTAQVALPPNLPVSFLGAERALLGTSSLMLDPEKPVTLEPLDRGQLQRLIALADPSHDRPTSIVRYEHEITLMGDGYSASRITSTSTGAQSDAERLRPAIAAANRFDIPMPWHQQRLHWPWTQTYASSFIASLGAKGDADQLYAALEANPDILLPFLGSYQGLMVTGPLLDDRLAPIVHRFISLGDDAFFEALCNLALHIQSSAAGPILKCLLDRWVSRFDLQAWTLQGESFELWRGFARLKEHPRFRDVPGWRATLERILPANIRWFHRQEVLRALEIDPASYVTIERCLSREEDWITFNISEIDRLDDSADRLFDEATY